MAAVSQTGHALRYAADKLRSDREIVMTAVSTASHTLPHAGKDILESGCKE